MNQKYHILKPDQARACIVWLHPHVTRRLLNQELTKWKTSSISRIIWEALIKEDKLDDLATMLTVTQTGKNISYHQASVQLLHDFINGFSSLSRAIKEEKIHA